MPRSEWLDHMQASDSQLKQTWFWLGVLAVVGVALIARWALYQERTSLLALRHTYERIICADELRSNLTDNEVWALGFVLTGDPSYLKLYDASEKTLDDRADKLRKLVQNDPKQRAHFERLSPLLQRQIAALSETVRPRNAATLDASHAGILTERGTQLMDQIRQIIGEIRNQEQNTLPWLLQKRRSRLRAGFAAIFSSALLAICSLLLARTNLTRNIFRRQRAEEELRTSEKRFEILCEQAPIGIYETDAQGLCVYTNRWWSERSGLNATESLGRGWQKAVHPDDLVEGWEAAALRGAWWEYRLLTTRGDVRWIRASGGPIYSPGGTMTGFVGTLEDITERKQAEQALRERDALNRAVLNSLPANIAVLNGDGIIQVTNEAWRQFAQANGNPPSCSVDTGADYLEVSKRAADAGSEEAAKAFTGIHDVLMGTLQSFEMQYPCHSSSEKRWFHMVVTFLAGVSGGGAVIAHVDVTRRKRSEEALRQSQTQLASDLDAMTRLQKLGTLFVCESNLAVVLDAIADAAIAISRADFGTIQLLDPASSTLKIVAQRGFPSWWIDFWARVFESRGVCGTALERGERVIVEDVEESPIFAGTPALEIQLQAGVRAVQSTPLVSRSGKPLGMFSTHYKKPHRPDERALRLLDLLARQAADIIDHVKSIATIRASEERFRAMADGVPVPMWVCDADAKVQFVNKAYTQFFGITLEDLSLGSWQPLIHPDDVAAIVSELKICLRNRRFFHAEARVKRRDGEWRWMESFGQPRPDGSSPVCRRCRTYFRIGERVEIRSCSDYNKILLRAPL